MTRLAEATVLYAVAVSLVCLFFTASGRARPRVLAAALVLVAVAAAGTSLLGAVSLLRGPRPVELATHLGYLVTAPLVLPVTASSVADLPGRWQSAAFAVGALVLAVVLVRVVATGG